MSNVPMIRRFTRVAPGALNVFALATDDETGLTFIRVSGGNAILDVVSSPQNAAGINHTVNILKNGIDTGRRLYSTSLDPASAGRMAIGPIALSPGDYSFNIAQTLGALTAYSFQVKFARQP